eukprot:m.93474 g.93474  ORF g.93474 m.93474 type:complete len:796 (-) comp14986_c0_seq1:24-2411(-)
MKVPLAVSARWVLLTVLAYSISLLLCDTVSLLEHREANNQPQGHHLREVAPLSGLNIRQAATEGRNRQPSGAHQKPKSPEKTQPEQSEAVLAKLAKPAKDADNSPPQVNLTNLTGSVQVKISSESKPDILPQPLPAKCNATLHFEEYAELHPEQHALYVDRTSRTNKDKLQRVWTPSYSQCGNNHCYQPEHHRDGVLSAQCLAAAESLARSPSLTPQPHFTHVINPFPNKHDPQYNWTLQAIQDAVSYGKAHGIVVQVLAVMFQREAMDLGAPFEEHAILCNWRNGYCSALNRWGGLSPDELPVYGAMVDDVWRTGYELGRGKYFIYTNYDIIVRQDFYVKLQEMFEADTKLRFIDNFREDLVVPINRSIEGWSTSDIFAWQRVGEHPGHDCFVLPRVWVPCLHLADFMMGMGYWGVAVVRQIRQLADMFGYHVLVGTFKLTRHLGRRVLSGDKFIGSGKDWQDQHDQQRKHNHWQYTKIVFRMRHEQGVYDAQVREGQHLNWSHTVVGSTYPNASAPLPCRDRQPAWLSQTERFTWAYVLPGVDQFVGRRVLELASGYATGSAFVQPHLDDMFIANQDCDAKMLVNYVDGRVVSLQTTLAPSFTGTCSRCQGLDLPQRALVLVDHPLLMIWQLVMATATAGNFAGLQLPLYEDEMIALLKKHGLKMARDITRRLDDIIEVTTASPAIVHTASLEGWKQDQSALQRTLNWLMEQDDVLNQECIAQQWGQRQPAQVSFNQLFKPQDQSAVTVAEYSREDAVKLVEANAPRATCVWFKMIQTKLDQLGQSHLKPTIC